MRTSGMMMKKWWKLVAVAVLAVCTVVLAGCGLSDPFSGKWYQVVISDKRPDLCNAEEINIEKNGDSYVVTMTTYTYQMKDTLVNEKEFKPYQRWKNWKYNIWMKGSYERGDVSWLTEEDKQYLEHPVVPIYDYVGTWKAGTPHKYTATAKDNILMIREGNFPITYVKNSKSLLYDNRSFEKKDIKDVKAALQEGIKTQYQNKKESYDKSSYSDKFEINSITFEDQ